eukprot:6488024-Amphidinium_carterae.1
MASLADIVLLLGKPTRVLSPQEAVSCRALTELVKECLYENVDEAASRSHGRPVLFQYASDCTPMKVAHRIQVGASSARGCGFSRQGYSMKEFLVQSGFLKYWAEGNKLAVKAILREPLPLEDGKKATNLFTAAERFIPKLENSTSGIRIAAYVFDRAQYSSLGRMLLQCQRVKDEQYEAQGGVLEGLLTMPVVVACAAHDAQNALKWGLNIASADADMIKDLHIVIEALRNSMDALGQNLARFVSEHLMPATDVLQHDVLQQLWAGLGINDDSLHFLVSAQLRFQNDQLLIHPEFADRIDAPKLVADALLGLAKFPKFTESRWLSVATAARALTAVLLVGMDSSCWVETCFKAEHHSEYYLGGYRRMTPQHKSMIIKIAMASYPADAFLAEVLEDDRLNRSSGRYAEVVLDEIVYLANVDMQ